MIFDLDIANALISLKEGKTILYPTDTVWGIGCDATNELAVSAIYKIKERKESKSLVLLSRFHRNVATIYKDSSGKSN